MSNLVLIAAAIAATPLPATEAAVAAKPGFAESPSAKILDDDLLKNSRGAFTLIMNDQTLESVMTGNTIIGDYTAGSITLSDSVLTNFNGVGNFMINSGALNSLQTGLALTINVGP